MMFPSAERTLCTACKTEGFSDVLNVLKETVPVHPYANPHRLAPILNQPHYCESTPKITPHDELVAG